ncbi:hypothetical protein GBA52_009389 [Prunus armeniaca]|nr:hypothetical protein GBA52_009389 [Prunus armeniaca]
MPPESNTPFLTSTRIFCIKAVVQINKGLWPKVESLAGLKALKLTGAFLEGYQGLWTFFLLFN